MSAVAADTGASTPTKIANSIRRYQRSLSKVRMKLSKYTDNGRIHRNGSVCGKNMASNAAQGIAMIKRMMNPTSRLMFA